MAYALIAASGAGLVSSVRDDAAPRLAREAAVALAVLALMLFTLQSSVTDGSIGPERDAVRHRAEIGRWLRAN